LPTLAKYCISAVFKVLADILLSIDSGEQAGLALLDLSAAFDTVDRDVFLQLLVTTDKLPY